MMLPPPEDRPVRARHPDIPQDPLPLPGLDEAMASKKRPGPRQRRPVTVGKGKCPTCGKKDLTMVRTGGTGRAWRKHYRVTIKGTSILCPESGQAVPE